MAIINYKIDKVEGKVDKRGAEKVDVKEGFGMTEVTKKNAQMLDVKWSFDIEYKGIGKMAMEGGLTYVSDKLEEKYEEKTIKGKKTLVLKGDALKDVSNFILRRGIIEAIVLSKTLMLPAPIQLPSVKVEMKE